MIDRLLIGWHTLIAETLGALGWLRALPGARRRAELADMPVAFVRAMGRHDASHAHWERVASFADCGCLAYRGHVRLYALECPQHDSGLRDLNA